MSVVVVGSANLDEVHIVESLPSPGETVMSMAEERHGGGKGLNQAVAAARAGANSTFVASIGDDNAGSFLSDIVEAAAVRGIWMRSTQPTGRATVIRDHDGENLIVVSPGANRLLVDLDDEARMVVARANVVLLQMETPLAVVAATAALGKASGTTVMLNAAPPHSLPQFVLDDIDILVVNEHEAAILTCTDRGDGQKGTHRENLEALLRLVPTVVMTLGADGAIAGRRTAEGTEITLHGAPTVEVVDTTGAGDTFCGVLAGELDRGLQLTDAIEVAITAASLAVGRSGAVSSIPTREQIDHQLDQEPVHPLRSKSPGRPQRRKM